MVVTRGKPGDRDDSMERESVGKELTESELVGIQTKLKQKEAELTEAQDRLKVKEAQLKARQKSLTEEATYLTEQRKKQDKRGRDLELLQERMEKNADFRNPGAVVEDLTALRNDLLTEMEEMRREMNRLRRENSPSLRLSGQPLDEYSRHADLPPGPPHHPKISFREATESVPSFNGYNIPLGQFTRACRRAREIIPPSSERDLTKLLINKLHGRAHSAVEDEPCESITQLIDLLNNSFGPAKTIDQYRGDLSTIYLRPQEHMLDYIGRVKELRSAIFDAKRRVTGNISSEVALEIDEFTARSFCEGLPLQYRLQLDRRLYSVPFEAFARAKELAKREELDRDRNRLHDRREPGLPRNEFVRQPRVDATPRNNNNLRERYANQGPRDNYTRPPAIQEREPRSTPNDGRRAYGANATTNAPGRYSDRSNKWCRYCKNNGHEIEECRKREYNNSVRKNETGNAPGPAGRTGTPYQGAPPQTTRTVNVIEETDVERPELRP